MEIKYKCEVCGNEFTSKRVRKGKLVCGTCAGELRKKGQGTVQLARAVTTGVVPVVEAKAEKPAEQTVEAPVEPKEAEKPAEGNVLTAAEVVETPQGPPTEVPQEAAAVTKEEPTSLADLARSLREKHKKTVEGAAPGEPVKEA